MENNQATGVSQKTQTLSALLVLVLQLHQAKVGQSLFLHIKTKKAF